MSVVECKLSAGRSRLELRHRKTTHEHTEAHRGLISYVSYLTAYRAGRLRGGFESGIQNPQTDSITLRVRSDGKSEANKPRE